MEKNIFFWIEGLGLGFGCLVVWLLFFFGGGAGGCFWWFFFFAKNKIPELILDQRKIWGFALKWFKTFKIFCETAIFKEINFKIRYHFKTRNKKLLSDDIKSKFLINLKNIPSSFAYYSIENQIHR